MALQHSAKAFRWIQFSPSHWQTIRHELYKSLEEESGAKADLHPSKTTGSLPKKRSQPCLPLLRLPNPDENLQGGRLHSKGTLGPNEVTVETCCPMTAQRVSSSGYSSPSFLEVMTCLQFLCFHNVLDPHPWGTSMLFRFVNHCLLFLSCDD